LAALGGSLVNLPISCYLTQKLGVVGVIWGTVLTTLFSNFLIPVFYIFRVLHIQPRTFLTRTLCAPAVGAVALIASTCVLRYLAPVDYLGAKPWSRASLLLVHLSTGCIAYIGGYLLVPYGRGDLAEVASKLRWR